VAVVVESQSNDAIPTKHIVVIWLQNIHISDGNIAVSKHITTIIDIQSVHIACNK